VEKSRQSLRIEGISQLGASFSVPSLDVALLEEAALIMPRKVAGVPLPVLDGVVVVGPGSTGLIWPSIALFLLPPGVDFGVCA
jgi:hypothetical protein